MEIRTPKKTEMKSLKSLLRKYGDVPSEEALAATRESKRKQWLIATDKNIILGGGRTYKSDWYSHTIKNAFVVPQSRGRGIATKLYQELTKKAEDEGAKVFVADITATNIPSKIGASRAGLRPVDSFKWDKKETHADVYHGVAMPPRKSEVLRINKYIDKEFGKRKKKTPPSIKSFSPEIMKLSLKPKKRPRKRGFKF